MHKSKGITNIINHFPNQKINLDELLTEYEPDFSLFADTDERILDLEDKWKNLDLPKKIVLVLYAEYGSFRKVGQLLGLSHTTIAKYIQDIRLWLT